MQNVKNVTDSNSSLLSTDDMLSELTIGISQLRSYLKDGRLPGERVRGKWKVTRRDFNDFKLKYGF